jgi:hypothetical protein
MARLAAVFSRLSAWCEKPGSATRIAWVTFVVLVVVGYPGLMTEDSVSQLAEARGNSFSGKHPPVYAYIGRSARDFNMIFCHPVDSVRAAHTYLSKTDAPVRAFPSTPSSILILPVPMYL